MINTTFFRILCTITCVVICLTFPLCGCSAFVTTDNNTNIPTSDNTANNNLHAHLKSDKSSEDTCNTPQSQSSVATNRDPQNFSVKDDTGFNTFLFEDISDNKLLSSYEAELGSNTLLYPRIESVSQISPVIVICEVIDLYYTDQIQTYWTPSFTVYDVQIIQVLRGDFVPGDIISIEEQGGYIRGPQVHPMRGGPLEEGGYIKVDLFSGAPEPMVGEKYILFLEESNEITNTYSIMGAYTGKYIIDENNLVSRFLKDNEFWTYGTLDEAIGAVNENSFNEDRYLNLDANTHLNTLE